MSNSIEYGTFEHPSREEEAADMQRQQGQEKYHNNIESLPNELLVMIVTRSENWDILLVSRRFASLFNLLPEGALASVAKDVLFRPELGQGNQERQDNDAWTVRSENVTERPTDAHFQLRRLLGHPRTTISTIKIAGQLWLLDRFEPAFKRFLSNVELSDSNRAYRQLKFEGFLRRAHHLFGCATGLDGCVDHKPRDNICYKARATSVDYGNLTLRLELSCHKRDSHSGLRLRPATLRIMALLVGSRKSKNDTLQAADEHGRAICADMTLFQSITRHRAATVPPELIGGLWLDVPERREVLRYILDRTGVRAWALPAGSELAAAGAEAIAHSIERADFAVISAYTGISLLLESESASWTLTEPQPCLDLHSHSQVSNMPFITAFVAADLPFELSRKRFLTPHKEFHQRRHLHHGVPDLTIEPWHIADGRESRTNKRLVTLDLKKHVPAILNSSDRLGADWTMLLLIAAFYHGEFTPDLHCFPWPSSEVPAMEGSLRLELLGGLARLVHQHPEDWRHRRQVVAFHHWLSGGERKPRDGCFQDRDLCRCEAESRAGLVGAICSEYETALQNDAPKHDCRRGIPVPTYSSLRMPERWQSIDQVLFTSGAHVSSNSAAVGSRRLST